MSNALAFARSHDWGQAAYQVGPWIHGLDASYTHNGVIVLRTASCFAAVPALRRFGQY